MENVPEPFVELLTAEREAAEPLVLSLEDSVPSRAAHGIVVVDAGGTAPIPAIAPRIVETADGALADDGALVVRGAASATPEDLAALRNGLWPAFHVVRARVEEGGRAVEWEVGGCRAVEPTGRTGWSLLARRRLFALSPDTTQRKFDENAAGWSGDERSPAYPHFRWMRRIVAEFGAPAKGERVLDAGCGAGWVGIEAARLGGRVSAFDPSPRMVEFARANAEREGVTLDARVGFVERPPFEESFPLVLNSGVLSFAPDADRFLDGLTGTVAPGGRLVIGDLHPGSRGFERRRRRRPVLPAREMNALAAEDVARRLERRGLRVVGRRSYQTTSPFPEILHRTSSRAVGRAVLWVNRLSAFTAARFGVPGARWFDSWLLLAVRPKGRSEAG